MNSRQIRLELEACRPGRDDLSASGMETAAQAVRDSLEWAQAYEQTQRVDTAISAALRDVSIPAGLEARLLAALQAAPPPAVDDKLTVATGLEEVTGTETASGEDANRAATRELNTPISGAIDDTSRRDDVASSRRWGWLLAAAATVALTIAAWMVPGQPPAAPMVAEHLGIEAVEWSERLTDEWLDLETLPNQDRPVDRFVRLAPHGWQVATNPYDAEAIAYDLSRPRGAGYLFVLRPSDVPGDLEAFANRVSATGGWGAAAWRRRDLVYVLLVEERRQRLEDFLQRSATEVIAWSGPSRSR